MDLPHVSLWFLRCLLPAGKFPESAVRAAGSRLLNRGRDKRGPSVGSERGGACPVTLLWDVSSLLRYRGEWSAEGVDLALRIFAQVAVDGHDGHAEVYGWVLTTGVRPALGFRARRMAVTRTR